MVAHLHNHHAGEPNELVAQIHTGMPVILPEEDHAKCLGEVEDGDLKGLLKSLPADEMRIWAISPRVNSSENFCVAFSFLEFVGISPASRSQEAARRWAIVTRSEYSRFGTTVI
jgi:hypothetical protein